MAEGRKILVTGATGQVAGPVATSLARDHEVWAAARFSDERKREALSAEGVRCIASDLAAGDFAELPRDFDHVLHFAVARSSDFDGDFRVNAEATGALMSHCRAARSFLHCSTSGVYQPNGHALFTEESPLGDNHRVMMPTYSLSKIAAEAVVRFAAREFDLPTTIVRLNTPYGSNGGWPFFHLEMIKKGLPIPVHSNAPSRYTLLHEDDIVRTVLGLAEAATVPARIVNWCGQEHVSIEEWCAYLGNLIGIEPVFDVTDRTLESVMTDNRRMRELVGPARVDWRSGLRRMVEERHPDWLVA
ncbi:MAG TPA: NAD(P)-dependent oxidoreductase [Deltaproteobacteria bacterium]|nr:NAD(P)-dependent oxidoreductase [Deltaproteobacteria bacterium]